MTQEQTTDLEKLAEIFIRHTKPDRIQGFDYKPYHVIRDVFKKADEQEIWRIHQDEPDAFEQYDKQCEIERVKVGLRRVIAALSKPNGPPVRTSKDVMDAASRLAFERWFKVFSGDNWAQPSTVNNYWKAWQAATKQFQGGDNA